VQVEAEVVGQLVAAEDVGQQLLVARPEQHHVVRHAGVLPAVPKYQTNRLIE
jgi:hypothetical protein